MYTRAVPVTWSAVARIVVVPAVSTGVTTPFETVATAVLSLAQATSALAIQIMAGVSPNGFQNSGGR